MPRFRLIRSASFRLAAAYLGLFTLSVLILGAVVFVTVRREAVHDVDGRIEEEASALQHELAENGRDRLIALIEARGAGAGAFAYGFVDPAGRLVAGVLGPASPSVPLATGWTALPAPERDEGREGGGDTVRALVTRLDDGSLLVVGDEWKSAEHATRQILIAFAVALGLTLALGALGGLALSAQVLGRLDAMSRAARAIIAGDWRQRIPDRGESDELAELARTFNRMFDRIAALLAANKHAGDAIAHDLRKPLAGALRRLETARAAPTSEARDAALEGAVADIHGVLGAFAAILRIGQIEVGARRAGFKPLSLERIVRDVAEAFQPAAEEQGKTIAVSFAAPFPFVGDAELLTQAFANLLDNALVHTPAGVRIAIVGTVAGGVRRVEVRDDGPGVPEADLARIFERFARVDAARATPGAGLGLALVAAVADLHGMTCAARNAAPGLTIALEWRDAADRQDR